MSVNVRALKSVGFEQITDLTSVKSLTPSIFSGADTVFIQIEEATVRWRDDGADPTNIVGLRLALHLTGGISDSLWYRGDLSKLRFIQEEPNAVLNIAYYESS